MAKFGEKKLQEWQAQWETRAVPLLMLNVPGDYPFDQLAEDLAEVVADALVEAETEGWEPVDPAEDPYDDYEEQEPYRIVIGGSRLRVKRRKDGG